MIQQLETWYVKFILHNWIYILNLSIFSSSVNIYFVQQVD